MDRTTQTTMDRFREGSVARAEQEREERRIVQLLEFIDGSAEAQLETMITNLMDAWGIEADAYERIAKRWLEAIGQ